MRNKKSFYRKYSNKIETALFQLFKKVYQQSPFVVKIPKKILFIIGCSRSGTSMMINVFKRDFSAQVFEDRYTKLTTADTDNHIRLNPLSSIEKIFDKVNAPLIVTKPIVETQNSDSLLDYFSNSVGLWIYRDYRDVAFSNLNHFGLKNGISNIRPIVKKEENNWRSENIPTEVKKIIFEYYASDMNPYDAAALFWYVRNYFFFFLDLDKRNDVIICKYEDFVEQPGALLKNIYKKLEREYPGHRIAKRVHRGALNKGKDIPLSEDIDNLCKNLQKKLDLVYKRTSLPKNHN